MKVVHLLPSLQSGGVEQVVLELGEGLSRAGVENIVVSAGGVLVPTLEAQGSRHLERPIGKKSPATLLQIPAMENLLRRERPNILHLHSRMPAWVGFLAWKLLPSHMRPGLVTTFHGFHSVNGYSSIMARGQRVVAVSECMRAHILEHYPKTDPASVAVIPNSVDTERNYPGYCPSAAWRGEWQREFPELQGKYTLCLPGRITRLKGHEDLIPILQKLCRLGIPAHAVIVGEVKKGKEAYRNELLSKFRNAGLQNAVTWTGQRGDLRDILCACNVTLSLSIQPESFGKTTLEALALGRPVAGYGHGGVGEQLAAFLPEGRVAPGDAEGMTSLLARWHAAPRRPVSPLPAPYRRQDMIEAHLQLYEELTAR